MSYYGDKGYRVERTARYDEEEQDFLTVFQLNFENLDRKASGKPDWTSREEAEEAAQGIIENRPGVLKGENQ